MINILKFLRLIRYKWNNKGCSQIGNANEIQFSPIHTRAGIQEIDSECDLVSWLIVE